MVAIISHKSNSKYKLDEALRVGARGAEFDIQSTSDGMPILVHDRRLPSEFRDVPLLESGYLRSKHAVISLEDFIIYAKQIGLAEDFEFHAEIKTPYYGYNGVGLSLAENIVNIFAKHSLLERCVIHSFFPEHIVMAKTHSKGKVGTALSIRPKENENLRYDYKADSYDMGLTIEMIEEKLGFIPDILSVNHEIISDRLLDAIHNVEAKCCCWTVNNLHNIVRKYSYKELDYIITDIPILIKRQLERGGKNTTEQNKNVNKAA